MSLLENRGAQTKAFKDLGNRWVDVKSSWQHTQADNFEKLYLLPLEAELRKALAAMDHMNIVLNKIERECA